MKNTIQYDSKSKEFQEKANCKLNLGSGMLVFFFPFFENLGSYVYDSMLYGMRARALARSLCMLARARAGPPATADPALGHSEAAPQSGQMSCGR